jgi:hypothetical protein
MANNDLPDYSEKLKKFISERPVMPPSELYNLPDFEPSLVTFDCREDSKGDDPEKHECCDDWPSEIAHVGQR